MSNGPHIAEIAALIGDPARANILTALLDGRALTATELAFCAHVSPQTTSGHLGKLTEAGLLQVERQGRHRYYRLASARVAQMLEGIMVVAAETPRRFVPRVHMDVPLRTARTCYDHLAGRLGVALADSLARDGHVVLSDEGGEVTETGLRFLREFGLALDELARRKRVFCRPCLDWSERRPHIAGAVGAGLAACCLELGWVRRNRASRVVTITPAGHEGFARVFGFDLRLAEGGTRRTGTAA